VVIADRRLFGAGATLLIQETKRKSFEELGGEMVIFKVNSPTSLRKKVPTYRV
jgi:hypothetical protein